MEWLLIIWIFSGVGSGNFFTTRLYNQEACEKVLKETSRLSNVKGICVYDPKDGYNGNDDTSGRHDEDDNK